MTNSTCTFSDCGRPLESVGLCQTHNRRRRTGKPMDAPFKPHGKVVGACRVDGCAGPIRTLGLCIKHYRRHTRHGDVAVNKKFRSGVDGVKLAAPCRIEGCDKVANIRDLCIGHYGRWQKSRDVQTDVPLGPRRSGSWPCSTEHCEQTSTYGSWCRDCARERGSARWREKLQHLRLSDPAGYRDHLDRSIKRARAWRTRNPEAYKNLELRKRAKRVAAPRIRFTGKQLAARMAYWGNRCWMCCGPFEEVDHVKPIAKGGWHALANLRPACFKCNNQKSDKWPVPVAPLSSIGVAA